MINEIVSRAGMLCSSVGCARIVANYKATKSLWSNTVWGVWEGTGRQIDYYKFHTMRKQSRPGGAFIVFN